MALNDLVNGGIRVILNSSANGVGTNPEEGS